MVKTLAIAVLATVMVMGVSLSSFAGAKDSAKDPSAGQSSSELGSMSPQSGSPSESGKTGIGSTSGADASVGTGLKSTTQVPCPEQSAASSAKPDSKVDASKPRSSAEMSARMGADPCMEGPASGPQKETR